MSIIAMSGVFGALQAAQALTKEEGNEAETTLEQYRQSTETRVVSMCEENQKLASLLQGALLREGTVTIVHSQTVQALEGRLATTEQILEETREQLRRSEELAKAQMKELIDSHKLAMENALAACRATAAAEQAAAVARCRTEAAAEKDQAIAAMKKKMEQPLEMIRFYATSIDGNCDSWISSDKGEAQQNRAIGRSQTVKEKVAVIARYNEQLKHI